jgi:hypothetical protein
VNGLIVCSQSRLSLTEIDFSAGVPAPQQRAQSRFKYFTLIDFDNVSNPCFLVSK